MFKKAEHKVQQKTSFWQSVSSTVTNLKYDITKAYKNTFQQYFQKEEDIQSKTILIQGKIYKNRYEAKKALKSIMWFSYRKGFNIKNQFTSDVGWGCLVRVGQMALASALIKYFESQKHLHILSHDAIVQTIIAAFTDIEGRQQKYSLNKILEIANNQFQQKPGQWFDLSKISYCLRVIQNKFPMRGAQCLEIAFFDQSLNFSTIFKIQGLKQCSCAKRRIVCQKCHNEYKPDKNQMIMIKHDNDLIETLNSVINNSGSMKKKSGNLSEPTKLNVSLNFNKIKDNLDVFRYKRFKRDLFVIILSRVADYTNVSKVNNAIFMLLDLKFCLGIMTGFPRQAIFVVGRQQSQLVYLNPHYVQNSTGFDSTNKESYFCQQYLLTERTNLDPSMAFCFYLQNLHEVQILGQRIQKLTTQYKDSLSICLDRSNRCAFNANDYYEQEEDLASVASFYL